MQSELLLFISHDSRDETLARLLKQFLESVFLNASVFVSGADLHGGHLWIGELRTQLSRATAILVLVSPRSRDNSWVMFEAGAGFCSSKTIPVLSPGEAFSSLQPPLRFLQGRLFSTDGLQLLAADISTLAGLRIPSRFPDLSEIVAEAEEFVQSVSVADKPQSVHAAGSQAANEAMEEILTESIFGVPDPQLRADLHRLRGQARKLLLISLERALDAFELPEPEELSKRL